MKLHVMVRAGAGWRLLPHDFSPWTAIYQQSQWWIRAGVCERIVHHLGVLLRIAAGHDPGPTAVIFDSRTLQSSVESGERAGYDGAKRKRGRAARFALLPQRWVVERGCPRILGEEYTEG